MDYIFHQLFYNRHFLCYRYFWDDSLANHKFLERDLQRCSLQKNTRYSGCNCFEFGPLIAEIVVCDDRDWGTTHF